MRIIIEYEIQTLISSIYKNIYHFNQFEIEFVYFSNDVNVVLNVYVNEIIMNKNYAFIVKKIKHEKDCVTNDNLDIFSIERINVRLC